MKKALVDCWRGADLIETYEFPLPEAMVPGISPDDRSLIDQAKTALTKAQLASPPYADVHFRVRRPN